MCSQHVPGALGLVLRKMLYPALLGSCGRNVVFGQNVVLRHPHKIRIGDNVVVDDNCLLDAKGESNKGIAIGSGVFIGRNTILSCKNGDIEIERRREHRLQLRAVLREPRARRPRHAVAAYCYLIGGDHEAVRSIAPVLAQGRASRGVIGRRRRVARRGRQAARRRRRSAMAPSSAPAPSCASRCRHGRLPSAFRRASSAIVTRRGSR